MKYGYVILAILYLMIVAIHDVISPKYIYMAIALTYFGMAGGAETVGIKLD